ncbi:MAG TPA: GNAT family N-acetyltransferase [Fimbriimonadaceae bacterium]|nr:GNAT family N-acetyltransferase [Fimbriimonadaceae bacterium]
MDPQLADLRPLSEADYEAVADLYNRHDPHWMAADMLRDRLTRWPEGDPRIDLAAVRDGRVFGYGASFRRSSDPEGKFTVQVVVDPEAAGQGLAWRLLAAVEEFGKAHEAAFFQATAKEKIPSGIAFAAKAGYTPIQRLFDSVLALEDFDLEASALLIDGLKAHGYRFTTLADEGNTEENRRRLYELDIETDIDTPGFENWGTRTYEQYSRDEYQSPGFSPGNVVLAARDGHWIAMHSFRPSQEPGTMSIDYTGVMREHRGRGLALALKYLGIQIAKRQGALRMQTHNDERNAAMLAVNAKLGFRAEPGFLVLRKDLTGEVARAGAL